MIEVIILFIIFIVLIIPTGKYLYKIISGEKSFVDPFFDKVDNFIYKVTNVNKEEMNWKVYIKSLIIFNLIQMIVAFIVLKVQSLLFLNPNNISDMSNSLSLNTAISFVTNTNLQNYTGETGVSYLTQLIVMTYLMFTSAASGFAAASAFIRGLAGKKTTVGNFFVDLVRIITRLLLPISLLIAILLVSQGVPQTFSSNITVTTIEGKTQVIGLGPIASLESIKHLGTNGGGFFGANSAHPFENPTPITNIIEMLSMMLLPGSLIYTFGLMIKSKKQSYTIFVAMSLLLVVSIIVLYFSEKAGNPKLIDLGIVQGIGNMEGKELRFGITGSTLFSTITTAFTTGSVNTMHDSLMPLGGFITLWNMMLNVIFGGKGVGLMGMIMYMILAVFLCGLMVGRTPEFLRKKIEGKEIKLIALAIIIHPLIILLPTALALVIKPGLSSIGNPGYHGLSEVLYQFTTAAANNGSSFGGLYTNTTFWNISTAFIMIIGRYISMALLLAVSGSLASKRLLPENESSFRTDNGMFVIILVVIVIIIGALTFLPSLALGPIAEHLIL